MQDKQDSLVVSKFKKMFQKFLETLNCYCIHNEFWKLVLQVRCITRERSISKRSLCSEFGKSGDDDVEQSYLLYSCYMKHGGNVVGVCRCVKRFVNQNLITNASSDRQPVKRNEVRDDGIIHYLYSCSPRRVSRNYALCMRRCLLCSSNMSVTQSALAFKRENRNDASAKH